MLHLVTILHFLPGVCKSCILIDIVTSVTGIAVSFSQYLVLVVSLQFNISLDTTPKTSRIIAFSRYEHAASSQHLIFLAWGVFELYFELKSSVGQHCIAVCLSQDLSLAV